MGAPKEKTSKNWSQEVVNQLINTNMKEVEFSIALAKSIQEGKLKGHIHTLNGLPAKISEFHLAGSSDIVVIRPTLEARGIEWCYPYKKNGHTMDEKDEGYFLSITIEEEDATMFHPFDKVLVRCQEYHVWEPGIFKSYDTSTSKTRFKTFGDAVAWNYCIPYEGNEHLLGLR